MKKNIRFPVLVMLLLSGVFVLGATSGMFIYATGEKVITTPKMLMVSHTEYRYSEPGQIVARLVDFQGAPVTIVNCTATILYPDKTSFVSGALMQNTTAISGDHYYNFTTPAGPEGVYEYQATCYYYQGAVLKSQSVTNSFHLSSAFTNVLANQAQINSTVNGINTTVNSIQAGLVGMNTTLNGVAANLSSINASLSSQITGVTGQITSVYDNLTAQVNANTTQVLDQMNANTSQILAAIVSANVTVNLTPVLNAIQANTTYLAGLITTLESELGANFTYTNGLITTLDSNMASNFTVVTSTLSALNVTLENVSDTVDAMSIVLDTVDTTTGNIYTYMTTTLVDKVDQALADLGVINATVNRIETVTTNINSTTTTILENQQNAVQMSVYSG